VKIPFMLVFPQSFLDEDGRAPVDPGRALVDPDRAYAEPRIVQAEPRYNPGGLKTPKNDNIDS
jgi:hypothetical protein